MLTAWRITKNVFFFLVAKWKIVLPLIAVIAVGLFLRSCWSKHEAKLTALQTVTAQQAIAKGDREEMTKVLVDVAVTEKNIDANLANSDRQKLEVISDARRKAAGMSNQELADTLNALANEQ